MKTVIIMRGISGAGKSTYAKNNFPNAVVCSADTYFIKDGYDRSKIGEAHKQCFKEFMDAISILNADCIVIDNTNSQLWEMSPYIAVATFFGYNFEIIEVKQDPDICFARGLHGVPLKKIHDMAKRFQKCFPWWNSRVVESGVSFS